MKKLARRQFIKRSGLLGEFLGSAGLGFYGYEAGRDPMTHTGNEGAQGHAQSFNRKRFHVDKPTYETVGPTRRVRL